MFSPSQQQTFVALMDRIIPADDFPSASQAGVETFIERIFAGDLRSQATAFANGLTRLDTLAREAKDKAFRELSAEAQDALLDSIEKGDEAGLRAFFNQAVTLVTEGYYADPGNGGNKNAISWKMIGYDPRIPGYDAVTIRRPAR